MWEIVERVNTTSPKGSVVFQAYKTSSQEYSSRLSADIHFREEQLMLFQS
jgi:hypothetical protein